MADDTTTYLQELVIDLASRIVYERANFKDEYSYGRVSGLQEACRLATMARDEERRTHKNAGRGKRMGAYIAWREMRDRCRDENNNRYADYGGRGISVCVEWDFSFASFLADMGGRPDGMIIDRVDPDGNYTPDNCRWSTPLEQRHNRRTP